MTYKTKQSSEILSCLQSFGGNHITVQMILQYFTEQGKNIGVATVYRQLDKLEQEGIVRKFISDGKTGACYQLIGDDCLETANHYHLKCEKCGALIHLHCDTLDSLEEHILADHGFSVNPLKTVFYGICKDCAGKNEK